ncbi:hypothetical protein [Mesorhizobium australafricanum]|uniref:ATPase involved in DNA repair n=1 Tax=Mesorhizobium australafricanum TaxID=3072311 RepID=A0ABU4WQP1_9HYPH|nr:hypothetical protein [Mesorhizobium sp. VK3E]MDX8438347.1 hypothetical protein [Mesorhizobium sp. VK3E]
MGDYTFDVPRARTRDVYRFFVEVGRLIGAPSFSLTEVGAHGATTISLAEDATPESNGLSSAQLYSVYQASIGHQNFSLTLNRLPVDKDALFDRIQVVNNEGEKRFAAEKVRRINELINETFQPGWEPSASLFRNPKAFSELIKSHQLLLGQLQSTTVAMTEQLAGARVAMETEFAERRSALEAEMQARQAKLDEAAAQLQRDVGQREESLLQRAKELDDRDHIHARRKLREDITKGIEARLASAIVPMRTSVIGWVVFVISLGVAGFLGWVSVASLVEYVAIVQAAAVKSLNPVSDFTIQQGWFLLGRGAVTGALSVAFLVYAITWLKSIYHADVRAQRELERYSIDLNRASWAVETIMEAKKDGGNIPDILVAGVSRNLFDSGPGKDAGSHSDGLGSLLRASARAKITTSGAEFEVNSRGANKLAKELEGEN